MNHRLTGACLALVAATLGLLDSGCSAPGKKLPDISAIHVRVRIERFDQDLSALDTNHLAAGLARLYRKYPGFLPTYFSQIMNYGPYNQTNDLILGELHAMLSSPDIRGLQDSLNRHFPSMAPVKAQLELGFRYMKYYFPDYRVPLCITFYSGLNNFGAVTVDTVLGIGLDMFLGRNYPFYGQVSDPYPQYMLPRFAPPYIVPDCFKAIEEQLYPPSQDGNTLLGQMLEEGKLLYFLDQVLPGTQDSLKIGFTGKQLDWCLGNEKQIWQYFIQNKLLYVRNMQQNIHYVGDGPSTQGMPPGAPGNIGSWVGWRIIQSYMRRHPGLSLPGLLEIRDAQKILEGAHYRP